MGALKLARLALLCAALGLLLPWHGLEDGFKEFRAWPEGNAAPLPVLIGTGGRWWLWPLPCLLLIGAAAALGKRAHAALLLLAGGGIIAWVFLMGEAIGLRGLEWQWLGRWLAEAPPQPSLGWGALLLLIGATGVLAAGLAARGGFRGDAFIAFLVTGSGFLLLLFVFAPLTTILLAAVYEGAAFAPSALIARLSAPEAWSLACLSTHEGCGVVWNTLLLATLTATISTAIGLFFALLAVRGGMRAAPLFRAMTLLPLITPPFVVAMALIVLFGRTGIVTALLWEWFDIPRSRWIYGLPGVLLAQVLAQAPIAFLLLDGALRAISPSLEEASATMGARRFTVFRTVT